MSTENNGNENKLTNRNLWKTFLHQLTVRGTNNYERQQNAGFTEVMMPVIEKYYEDPEEKKEVYARRMEYFLTNDITPVTLVGVAAVMEERCAAEGDIDPDSTNVAKTALMGPLAGLGDPLLNSTVRPILAGIAISLITAGLGWIGPIFFVIGTSIVPLGVRYLGMFQGYEQGVKFTEKIQSSELINRVSELAVIAAYVIVGGFIPALVVISTPIVYRSGDTASNIQEVPDGLMPGVLGMLYIGLMYLLTSKKKISVARLILVTMIMDIVGTYCGILGQDQRQKDDRWYPFVY